MKRMSSILLFAMLLGNASLASAAPAFFRTIGLGVERKDLYYSVDGKDVPLSVRPGRRSTFYAFENSFPPPPDPEVPAKQGIVMYRMEPGEEGMPPLRIPVAQVEMTDIQDRAILAVFEDPDAPEGLRVEAVPDGKEDFPPPGLLLVNLTRVKLAVLVGDSPGVWVPPNGVELMNLELEEETRGQVRQVTIGVKKGESGVRVYTNNWVIRPGTRTMVLMRLEDEQFRVDRLPERVQARASK